MRIWYLLSVWLHILAAAVWIGAMVFFAGVLMPVLRRPEFAAVRTPLLRRAGRGFRWLGWSVLAVLVLTGFSNLVSRGYGWSELLAFSTWSSWWGQILAWKLGLVVVLLLINLAHDVLGPRAARLMEEEPESPQTQRVRRLAGWLGRLELLVSLVILWLAVLLVRGGW